MAGARDSVRRSMTAASCQHTRSRPQILKFWDACSCRRLGRCIVQGLRCSGVKSPNMSFFYEKRHVFRDSTANLRRRVSVNRKRASARQPVFTG